LRLHETGQEGYVIGYTLEIVAVVASLTISLALSSCEDTRPAADAARSQVSLMKPEPSY
jgi:hypothetical protein